MIIADLSNKIIGYSNITELEKTTKELLVKIDSLIDEIGEELD